MTDAPMTVTAAHDVALAPIDLARPHPRVRFFVAFLISLIAALALGASGLYAFDRQYADRILPGVTVGGVDMAGMTPQEAKTRLGEVFASFGQGQAVLKGGGLEMPIDYADIDRRPDLDGMVAEAMAVGRSDKAVERFILNARTAVRGVDIPPRVLFDEARLARYIQTYAARLNLDPRDAAVTPTKDGFTVVSGVPGQSADRIGPTDLLTAALARADAPNEIVVELQLGPSDPDVTTAEATEALAAAERMVLDVAIVQGKESWTIPAATVRTWLAFEKASDGVYKPVVEPEAVGIALSAIAKKIGQTPQNASFKTSGGKITGVVAARTGRALDVPLTASRVADLLVARADKGTNAPVAPAMTVTQPSLTTEEASAVISKMTKISSWTTYFPISERNHFGANIWIPALDIDGYVVGPGEKFDFWNAVGPVTRAHGYGDGGAIINGKTEPQGALAGGICSCSTTLFNAALRAGFKMGARRNHYYFIDRYPAGLDATVFKSGSGSVQTMSWTNDTAYPVLIRGYKIRDGSKGYVRFELYSVPTGRKVVIGNPTIKNIRRASDTVQYTTSLNPGVHKRIEFPVDGKDVWRTVTVYQNGKILHQTTYYSHYSRVTGVTLIGKAG
jgi:vancomycin resistance protein YoaR